MSLFKHSRSLAVVGLLLAIVLSVFGGSFQSVRLLKNKTEKIYTKDDKTYGSPKEDIADIADYAETLNAIAIAANAQDLTDKISAVRSALTSPIGQGEAVRDLYTAAEIAYNQVMASGLSDEQKNSAKLSYYDANSAYMRLKNNEKYTKIAEKYNHAQQTFLGGLFAKEEATVYE